MSSAKPHVLNNNSNLNNIPLITERVTNPANQFADIAAIEAFCVMLSKESEGAHIASKLLATHIQSPTEWEALQALGVRYLNNICAYLFLSAEKFGTKDLSLLRY